MSIFIHQLTVPASPLCPKNQRRGLLLFPFSDPEKFMALQRAIAFAEEIHRGEERADGRPYITHPLAMMRILAETSTQLPFGVYLAAVLHDVLEVDRLIYPELLEEFGSEVAQIVWALTKPMKTPFCQGVDREQLYVTQMARVQSTHPETLLVKLADRTHNIETSRGLPTERAERMQLETVRLYLPLLHETAKKAPQNLVHAFNLLLARLEQSIVRQRVALNP